MLFPYSLLNMVVTHAKASSYACMRIHVVLCDLEAICPEQLFGAEELKELVL